MSCSRGRRADFFDTLRQVADVGAFDQRAELIGCGRLFQIEVIADLTEHAKDDGHLLFGEEIHLQIEMRAPVGFLREPVLARQHEERQEDRLQTDERRQEAERKGVEWFPGERQHTAVE
jgi:hypothetical protein